jgi:PKD repeat protein
VHAYAEEGIYGACLVVSNQFSSDTFCQTINLGVSNLKEPDSKPMVQVWPNPFGTLLEVWIEPAVSSPVISIYDITSQCILQRKVYSVVNEILTEDFPSGIYFYKVESWGQVVKQGKIVKM